MARSSAPPIGNSLMYMAPDKWFFAEVWLNKPGFPREPDKVIVVGKGAPSAQYHFEQEVKRMEPQAFETRVFVAH